MLHSINIYVRRCQGNKERRQPEEVVVTEVAREGLSSGCCLSRDCVKEAERPWGLRESLAGRGDTKRKGPETAHGA